MNPFVILATLAIDSLVTIFVVSLLVSPTLSMTAPKTQPQTASVASAFTEVTPPMYRGTNFVDLSDVLALVATSTATTSEEVEIEEEVDVEEEEAVEPKREVKPATQKAKPVVVQKTVTPTALPIQIETQTDETYAEDIRIEISKRTNAFRTSKDLHKLAYDMRLESAANKYSATLLRHHEISHNIANCDLTCRFNNNNYYATSWGENLATISFSSRPSASSVAATFMEEWQKSAGHRDNLLSDDFTHQGIGVSLDGSEVYVVVDFSKQ